MAIGSMHYPISSTQVFWGHERFNGFATPIPNVIVPSTEWSAENGGITRMCFDQVVSNPILIISSLGSAIKTVTLGFSTPFEIIYNGGGVVSSNDTSLTGTEGYAILLFPGDFTCVTIYSTTRENYTNISWGLNPPLFSVQIACKSEGCGSVTVTASGGEKYLWSGGVNPNSATNTFLKSGRYALTITDRNGCTVKTSKQINVSTQVVTDTSVHLCKGASFYGYTLPGRYIDTIRTSNNCDTIRRITITQSAYLENKISKTICAGQSYEGRTTSGVYRDTIRSIEGCDSVVTTTQLTVLQNCDINLPNAFSPNGDNKNDVFKIINGQQIETFRFEVFNRFGQKVFETNDYKAGWVGKFGGVLQPAGIYVWWCSFTRAGINGLKKGIVTLVN